MDDEILFENDPLAAYLKKNNIEHDIVNKNKVSMNVVKKKIKLGSNIFENIICPLDLSEYPSIILKSELLLIEDKQDVEIHAYGDEGIALGIRILRSAGYSAVAGMLYLLNVPYRTIVSTTFLAPSLLEMKNLYLQYKYRKDLLSLISDLDIISFLFKRSFFYLKHYMQSIKFYTSQTEKSSLYMNLVVFSQFLFAYTAKLIITLKQHTIELFHNVPLINEEAILEDVVISDDIKLKDIKLNIEYYYLVQSHFLKTIAYSCCPILWKTRYCDISYIFNTLIPSVRKILKEETDSLEFDLNNMCNFGRSRIEENKVPISLNYETKKNLYGCLKSAELHCHQQLCKIRDTLIMLSACETEMDIKAIAETLMINIKELQRQGENPAYYIGNAEKILQRALNDGRKNESEINLTPAINQENLPAGNMPTEEQEIEDDKECDRVYELYIPKEGLDPLDDEGQCDSWNEPDYSFAISLLEELRAYLGEKNPTIAEEREAQQLAEQERRFMMPETTSRSQTPLRFTNEELDNILHMRQGLQEYEETFSVDPEE